MPAADAIPSSELENWLTRLEGRHAQAIDLGLDRVDAVYTRLGRPRIAERVVTVAGTNGKGSTVHALEALAKAHGMSVGATVSPHLERFNERIRIDGREASDDEIIGAFTRIELARHGADDADPASNAVPGEISLTYFETAILAALLVIADRAPELAILEVGLGGRLDAVNIIDCDVAVIAPIDLDHQQWLGDDREAIGFEKAGILRARRPVIITDPDPPASVLAHARDLGAPCRRLGVDFDVTADDGRVVLCRGSRPAVAQHLDIGPVSTVHPGAVAGALGVLGELGVALDSERCRAALAELNVPGRFEQRRCEGRDVLLDVAHNPHAVASLVARLPVGAPWHLVFGAFVDKDVGTMIEQLAAHLASVRLVDTHGPRGLVASELAERWRRNASARWAHDVHVVGDTGRAVDEALDVAGTEGRVLICGSFTIVGAARAHLRARGALADAGETGS